MYNLTSRLGECPDAGPNDGWVRVCEAVLHIVLRAWGEWLAGRKPTFMELIYGYPTCAAGPEHLWYTESSTRLTLSGQALRQDKRFVTQDPTTADLFLVPAPLYCLRGRGLLNDTGLRSLLELLCAEAEQHGTILRLGAAEAGELRTQTTEAIWQASSVPFARRADPAVSCLMPRWTSRCCERSGGTVGTTGTQGEITFGFLPKIMGDS